MSDHLFVYGSLAPGQPNEHVLTRLGGSFQPASVRGHLRAQGWGAGLGFPGIVPDGAAGEVAGFVFTFAGQLEQWAELDAFEGAEYRRVPVTARLASGQDVTAWVYALAGEGG